MLTRVGVRDLRIRCNRDLKEVMCIRMTYAYDALLRFISFSRGFEASSMSICSTS